MTPAAKTGFENGQRVQVTEDDPSKHTTPGVCGHCNRESDLQCAYCRSTNVATDAGPASSARSLYDEKLRLLLLKAHEYSNSKFFLGCLLIATGDPAAAGVTMKEYGRKWGKSKAAVSKLCVWICEFLGIDPSAYMKSRKARESYRQSNWRPTKTKS